MSGNGARETRQEAADRVASRHGAALAWLGGALGLACRLLAGLGGAFGLAALWRFLRRAPAPQTTEVDPAEELRVRLEQAREAADDRDEFDASEGQPVDEVERPRSIEERRRAIHDKAQQALGEMHGSDRSD